MEASAKNDEVQESKPEQDTDEGEKADNSPIADAGSDSVSEPRIIEQTDVSDTKADTVTNENITTAEHIEKKTSENPSIEVQEDETLKADEDKGTSENMNATSAELQLADGESREAIDISCGKPHPATSPQDNSTDSRVETKPTKLNVALPEVKPLLAAGKDFIDLDSDGEGTPVDSGVCELIKRFVKHSAKRSSKKNMNVEVK